MINVESFYTGVPNEIREALVEIQKSRSDYQLKKFVVGQHDLPEQQYKQTLLEIQQLLFYIKGTILELKKQDIEITRLRSTKDEIDEIDAQIKELRQEQTKLSFLAATRELKDLVAIWEEFPIKYSYEELENSEPDYWEKRLTRQAALEHMGNDGKVGWASLDALRQIGSLDKVIMSDKPKQGEL